MSMWARRQNTAFPWAIRRGVLTETTAEMAVSLTFSAARRVVEADAFMRAEKYQGWLPNALFGRVDGRQNRGRDRRRAHSVVRMPR